MKRNKVDKLSTLNNDHVRINGAETERFRKQKARLVRRLSMFALVCIVAFGVLTGILVSKNATLKSKEEQKTEAIAKLEDAQEQQEMLNTQIKKLEDDEYIAKLLRKEYFLSEQGEIIFIIPDEAKNEDKN